MFHKDETIKGMKDLCVMLYFLALWNSDPVSIIRKVIERASEVTLERDSAGLTPLATAVGRGADMVLTHCSFNYSERLHNAAPLTGLHRAGESVGH